VAITIEAAHIENLRGYRKARLSLKRELTLLVGPNNSGKTSLLRILDWLLNGDAFQILTAGGQPPREVMTFLQPARATRNQARRLTLEVKVPDGRSHRRFQCEAGVAQLRLNVRSSDMYLALGRPRRDEKRESDSRALELLERLRAECAFLYVSSFRDAQSPRFQATLFEALKARVSQRALHATQGGAPAEYRRVKRALEDVKQVAEDLSSPLWQRMETHLPPGLAQNAKVFFESTPQDFVEWITRQLHLQISTGAHDSETVRTIDLGSGLQSLLELAVRRSEDVAEQKFSVLVVEEPESFLHPSAQRTIARALRSDESVDRKIITTHSPIIVEESEYSDVVLCRDQAYYEPTEAGDPGRAEINTAFQSGYGAEMMFAESVLLVEGEGDREFFEGLRRRIAEVDDSGATDKLFAVPVGGKHNYAPWMRLLNSYGAGRDRPIRWLAAADGDAGQQLRRAFSDANVTVPAFVLREIGRVGSQRRHGADTWARAVRELNKATKATRTPLTLLPVDLEYAALCDAGTETREKIARLCGSADAQLATLLRRLGSKAAVPDSDQGLKQPWVRGRISSILRWDEVCPDLIRLLQRWLEGAMSRNRAGQLLRNVRNTSASTGP